MCHKILLFNFDESKNSAKEHKFLMSKIWEIAFCVPSLFRRHVCLPNLKDSPSRELPLTARKTVFSHLNMSIRSIKGEGGLVITLFYFQNFNICKSSSEEECFYILQKCKSSFNNVFPLKGSLFSLICAGKGKRSGGNGTMSTLVTQSYVFTAACTRTILISVYDLISLQTVCMIHYTFLL